MLLEASLVYLVFFLQIFNLLNLNLQISDLTSQTMTLNWTAVGGREVAVDHCQEALASVAGGRCSDLPGVDIAMEMDSCIADIGVREQIGGCVMDWFCGSQ